MVMMSKMPVFEPRNSLFEESPKGSSIKYMLSPASGSPVSLYLFPNQRGEYLLFYQHQHFDSATT